MERMGQNESHMISICLGQTLTATYKSIGANAKFLFKRCDVDRGDNTNPRASLGVIVLWAH